MRFQIEFNFRDAKQHFGLEDFMNITPTAVNNAANLAMCMVKVSAELTADSGDTNHGVRDLKTAICGCKYINMVLKILPSAVQNVLKIPLEGAFLAQGRINAPPNDHRAASIGVGIVSHPHIMKFSIRALLLGMHQLRLQLRKDQQIPEWRGPKS